MKKIVAAIVAAILAVVPCTTTFAQTTDDVKFVLNESSSRLIQHPSGGPIDTTKREFTTQVLVVLSVYDRAFGKYLSAEVAEGIAKVKDDLTQMSKIDDENLTEEESDKCSAYFVAIVIAYGQATVDVPVDNLVEDVLAVAEEDYENLEESDVKKYLGLKIEALKKYKDMTDEDKMIAIDDAVSALLIVGMNFPFTVGDVNMDEKMTSADALLVLRNAVGAAEQEDFESFLSDFNGDGNVTSADALMILRRAVGA